MYDITIIHLYFYFQFLFYYIVPKIMFFIDYIKNHNIDIIV